MRNTGRLYHEVAMYTYTNDVIYYTNHISEINYYNEYNVHIEIVS